MSCRDVCSDIAVEGLLLNAVCFSLNMPGVLLQRRTEYFIVFSSGERRQRKLETWLKVF